MELEILTELQTPIGVGQRERALDRVGDGLANGVRQIVEGQQDDMIADPDTSVLTTPTHEGGGLVVRGCSPRRKGPGGELVGSPADES